jgi:hypothetical protein
MNADRIDIPGLVLDGERLFVPVEWEHADRLRSRLDRLGVAAVVEFNAATLEARVQVPADADPAALREAIGATRLSL